MVVHIFSLIFIAAMAYLSRPGSSKCAFKYNMIFLIVIFTQQKILSYKKGLFSWHPFLMTIGVRILSSSSFT